MKIVHISTFLQGGAGRIITDLAVCQKQMGHDVQCLTNNSTFDGYTSYTHYENELRMWGIPLLKIEGIFQRKDNQIAKASEEISTLYCSEPPDIVHSHAAIPALAFHMARTKLKANFPILQTMHGWGTSKKRIQEKQDISIFSNLDGVVAVSHASKDKIIQKGGFPGNLSVIVNGIVQKKSKNKSLERLVGNCRGKFLIGCVGTICDRKNQFLLLKALKNVRRDYRKKIICCLIGDADPDYSREIESFISQSGLEKSVYLGGYVESADEYISEFDLMVLPSKSEGLPITLLECFREKVLVLSSDIPENTELIQDEITGFTFSLEEEKHLRDLIEKVINLDRTTVDKILNKAASDYLSLYTVEKMADQYDTLYRDLIYSRSRNSM